MAKRISSILTKKENMKAKCVCYCLKPNLCEEMKTLLVQNGLTAECFTGKTSTEDSSGIMNRFRVGQTQIVCATKGETILSLLSPLDEFTFSTILSLTTIFQFYS